MHVFCFLKHSARETVSALKPITAYKKPLTVSSRMDLSSICWLNISISASGEAVGAVLGLEVGELVGSVGAADGAGDGATVGA